MFVCSCNAVRDHVVRDAIERGARTIEEIGEACGAGVRCGGCHPCLRQLLTTTPAMSR